MSVLNKIKNVIETVEDFPKDKVLITLTDNTRADIENYNTLKIFEKDRAFIIFDTFEVYIYGDNLEVDFFSPSRLVICGTIKSVVYMYDDLSDKEAL